MHKPLVSIIIVHHLGIDITNQCIESVLKSSYKHIEIVLVDNGSTDFIGSSLEKKVLTKKNVTIIHSKKNLHFTGGSNLGAKHAKGTLLVFLNNDTQVNSRWLEPLISSSTIGSKILVQPKILQMNNKDIIDNVGGTYVYPGFGFGKGRGIKDGKQFDKEMQTDYVNGTCFMIHNSFFKQLHGFDNNYYHHYEDVDLCLRAKKRGGFTMTNGNSHIFHKGSFTFKAQKNNKMILTVRKNILRTIIKNFHGIDRLTRILIMLCLYTILIVVYVITLRFNKALMTLQAFRIIHR
jgi:hypothetical protein